MQTAQTQTPVTRPFRVKHTKTVREIAVKKFSTKEAAREYVDFSLSHGYVCSQKKDIDGCQIVRVMEFLS